MIQLDENYSISNDSNNHILHYKEDKVKEDGKKYTSSDEWYFSTLEQALERYMDCSLKRANTAEQILAEIYKVKQIIAKLN